MIFQEGKPLDKALLLGVYDGHGGSAVSSFVANNIGRVFRAQCALTLVQYANDPNSIYQQEVFIRDHQRTAPRFSIHSVPAVNAVLDSIKFDKLIEGLEQLKPAVEKDSAAFGALSDFLKDLLFLDNCKKLAEKAQDSPLKGYRDANVILKGFIDAINWFASFVRKEPLIQTASYKQVTFFKEQILMVKEELSSPAPQMS